MATSTRTKKAKQLKQLQAKRAYIVGSINLIREFDDDFDETKSAEIPFRLERLDKLMEDLEKVETDLDSHRLGDPVFSESRAEMQTLYFRLKGSLSSKRTVIPQAIPPAHVHEAVPTVASGVRLPELRLPEFDGRPEDWSAFHDLFRAMIHDNTSLSAIQKLHYLRATLKGDAARVICSFPITSASYPIAWKMICDRYEDKHLLIKQHISALFSIAPMRVESAAGLSDLADEFEKHVKILDSLETKAQHWDSVLVELLFSRMDIDTQKLWENQRDKTVRPSYDNLLQFAHEHSRTLLSLKLSQTAISLSEIKSPKSRSVTSHSASESTPRCAGCKQPHFLFQCESFRAQTPQQRFDFVRRSNLCTNCLKSSHLAKNCTGGSCKYCQRKHHTLLHLPLSPTLIAMEAPPHTQPEDIPVDQQHLQVETTQRPSHSPYVALLSDTAVASVGRSISLPPPSVSSPLPAPSGTIASPSNIYQTGSPTCDSTVMLFTALVKVRDSFGKCQLARVLLDSGSQSNFVSESLCQRLSLNRTKINVPVSGIGQSQVNVRYMVTVQFSSRFDDQEYFLECLVLPRLTVSLPTSTVDINTWKIPKNLPLADPQFNVSHGVDIIVGAELFAILLQAEQISFNDHLPVLHKTSLGYVIAGRVPTNTPAPVACLVSTLDSLDAKVKKFWEIEDFDHGKALTVEETRCEEHFAKTHYRNAHGRYVVRLPVRQELLPLIGDTWSRAARRFTAVEKRFRTDEALRANYQEFMDEYELLGHMEEVKASDVMPQFILPHHAIHRPDSSTTKIRVVFDGSAKSSNNMSLNDMLLCGPTVQPHLQTVLLNFRLHRYVMKADIEKMFRQVLIDPSDRAFQQILWRKNETEPLTTYQLNTVTYGTSCAPYLATRALNQLAVDDGDLFPLAAPVVKEDFYVDDALTGANTIGELVEKNRQLTCLLERGGFLLRKWSANHPEILQHVPEELKETTTELELDSSTTIKTLGLLWFPSDDQLGFKVPNLPSLTKVTKRIALSEMSQLFDPLGLVGPIVASAKMFVQQLWQENLDWDDELPKKLQSWWLSFRSSIGEVRNFRVPRWVFEVEMVGYDLHCFTDASERGYGCCIYAVATSDSGLKTSNLLMSKSRVAPVAGFSIPRLELCAAVLGSQLVDNVLHTTRFSGQPIFWTDSSIVLHWIKSPPATWKVFVSNRISEIQRLTQGSQWRHVPTTENPADYISRGVEPRQLTQNQLWWSGPSFLLLPSEEWPAQILPASSAISTHISNERKLTVALHTSDASDDSTIRKHSELAPLLRITAYCLRFITNCRSPKSERATGNLTVQEYDDALKSLVRIAQRVSFKNEIRFLQGNPQEQSSLKNAQFKSSIKNLDLILDSSNLLRLNGRLTKLLGSYDNRLPMVLPGDDHLSHLIARSIHHQTLHAGPTQLLATMRQRFWPVRGKDLARRTVHRCVTCFRCRPKPSNQFMAPLPVERITPAKIFEHTGLDYCGPFHVRALAGRGASVKVWVAVYVCFAVKYVVLDIVAGLSATACVNSLRRFVSRVGRVRVIHCDNSTAFVGASREINEMRKLLVQQLKSDQWYNECLEKGIQFQFIPPRAPHCGGIWEAAVKSFKHHLVRILGSSPYELDELRTGIAQAEGILNSRPLTPLSNHPEDLSVLTPAHFILGESTFNLPEPDYVSIPLHRLTRFQMTQRAMGDLWKRWAKEYIGLLHQRPTKWRKTPTDFRVGAMVLLKNESSPPKQWPLGRVVAVYPNKDNIVRVVDVRTQGGIRRRATTELCLLPIEEDSPDAKVMSSEESTITSVG